MKVLLSIKPEFADKIFSGEKTYEFRKSVFRNRNVKTVVVYATRPVAQIIGEFDVLSVVSDSPDRLWNITEEGAGISREFFEEYFAGRSCAFALKIGNATLYDTPVEPSDLIENFTAPQSYMYVEDDYSRRREAPESLALF